MELSIPNVWFMTPRQAGIKVPWYDATFQTQIVSIDPAPYNCSGRCLSGTPWCLEEEPHARDLWLCLLRYIGWMTTLLQVIGTLSLDLNYNSLISGVLV